jgi:transposase-like protein
VHFLCNALDVVPRKVDDDCLTEIRWLYDRRESRRRGAMSRLGSPGGK